MSRPGDPGREQVTLTGTVEILADTAERVGRAGGSSFEYGYEAESGHKREPSRSEPVRWYCTAVMMRQRGRKRVPFTYKGTAVADPGESHDRALGYACSRLLEQLGANVIVFETGDGPEPRP